jgi:hypothetical protein
VYGGQVDDQLSFKQLSGWPVWLSGAVLTLLNKVVFPSLWLAFVVGVPLWVFVTYGRISIAAGFEFIVVFATFSTVVMVWMAVRLQRVGYCERELVIANYWRETRVPFDQIAAVEIGLVVPLAPRPHPLQSPYGVWLQRILPAEMGAGERAVHETGTGASATTLARVPITGQFDGQFSSPSKSVVSATLRGSPHLRRVKITPK